MVANGLLWSLTRADRPYPDRLVYQELPIVFIVACCRSVQQGSPGPVDFTRLHIDERHLLLAVATVWMGPPELWILFCVGAWDWKGSCALLAEHLSNIERIEFGIRQRRWEWEPGEQGRSITPFDSHFNRAERCSGVRS